MHQISRREFVALAALGAAAAPFAVPQNTGAAGVTAQEVVDRIKKAVGVDWTAETVDTFKAGDPATAAKGIVTTALATMNVLGEAVKAGANLVITCEPTFYAKADVAAPPARRGGRNDAGAAGRGDPPAQAGDAVFAAKEAFIRKHGLVVWRFSDHWRRRRPDPFAQGLTDALGWSKFRSADDPARVSTPEISLDALVGHIKKTLNARGGIRVVGSPQMKVRKIGVLPGSSPIQASLRMLPGVDVIVAGEVREWESVEYARDSVTAGGRKGLVLLGRVLSEEPGMKLCAQWLRTLVPELATTWIPAGDPYWRPR